MVKFLGVDVESTGLGESDRLLEVGMVAFDENLDVVDVFSSVVIDDLTWAKVDTMDDYVTQMHTDNGLLTDLEVAWDSGQVGRDRFSPEGVELAACGWMDSLGIGVSDATLLPMLGSSLLLDRNMLSRQMPVLYDRIHYRSVDTTGFRLWAEDGLGMDMSNAGREIRDVVELKYGDEPLIMDYPAHRGVRDIAYSAGQLIVMHNRIVSYGRFAV